MIRSTHARLLVAGLAMVTAGVGLAPSSSAAAPKKLFHDTLGVTDDGGPVAQPLTAGTSYHFAFTLRNDNRSPQAFGSARIVIPTGYDVTAVTTHPTGYPNFTVTDQGTQLLLTSSGPTGTGVAAGSALTVAVDVTTPSTGGCNATWTTGVKQSNDFSGSGNDFNAADPAPTTTVGSRSLSFTTAPSVTEFDKDMAPAPVVSALDACGEPVVTTVTLTDEAGILDLVHGTVSGDTSATTGQVSFSNLRFTDYGVYDRLIASASGFDSDTSQYFLVSQLVQTCATTASCTLPFGSKNNTLTTVTTATGAEGDYVAGSRISRPTDDQFPACSAQEGGGRQVSDTILLDSPRGKTVVMTIAKAYVNEVSNNGTPFMDICLSIPPQLQTEANKFVTKAAAGAGDLTPSSWQGLLPNCPMPNGLPCIVSRKKNAANEVITFTLPVGDPHVGAY